MDCNIQQEVLLAPYTTSKIGGYAQYLAEPNLETAPKLVTWAYEQEIPIYFVGRGSNVLIDDPGLPGLLILTRNSLTQLRHDGDKIIAGSGVFLPQLSKFAAREGAFQALSFSLVFPVP
ncbi:FAD-binding protein [Anabaenopsis elenkinii]|uniref:FAD-binding protein n=1 Tax=Anabaenopsis elenkinii CCIBt3563 TaxID=2779889 RepID=A0A7U3RXA7_9CYAN|nr:FAD-binding protein [Anabaenopsis elenkinii]QOV21569.1 FAD-binding protein [Anabaenopsis elenkinii CCIBt3563]